MSEMAKVDITEAEQQAEPNGSGAPAPAGSLRDRIKAADDFRSEHVEIPEWSVTLEVRSITGRQRARWLQKFADTETGKIDFEAMLPELLIASVFDPDTGARVFLPGDAEWLGDKMAGPLSKLEAVAQRLSGLTDRARADAGKAS